MTVTNSEMTVTNGVQGTLRKGAPTLPKVSGREPLLFTPGPLTTSATVKQAMLADYGSRDKMFAGAVTDVRQGLLRAGGVSKEKGYECVIVQGAGTMGVEAMIGTAVPRTGGKVLILVNGAYGTRQATMCRYLGIPCEVLEWPDSDPVAVKDTLQKLRTDATFTHVSMVHHETTAGVLNPLKEMALSLKAEFPKVSLLVDSMSGFGAYDLQMEWGIDFAVSSANKCIEGVPGFCFALVNREALKKSEGNARSLCLDLFDQWSNMEKTGQFRFTPPTHAILAFQQALKEFEEEGSVQGRFARYQSNYEAMKRGMEKMGFTFYVQNDSRSCLISTFNMPEHPNFIFQKFYDSLAARGFVIYPGKLAKGASFRFGTIGRIFPRDCELLCAAVQVTCEEMGVPLPLSKDAAKEALKRKEPEAAAVNGSKRSKVTPRMSLENIDLIVCDMAGTTVMEGGIVYKTLQKYAKRRPNCFRP